MDLFWGIQLMSWGGAMLVAGAILVIAYFYKPMNKLPLVNSIPKQYKAVVGIGLIVLAAIGAGVISMPSDTEQTTAAPVDYYNTSDIELNTYDDETGSTISGDVHWYETGATTEDYVTESADILRTVTTTSGTVTMSGWDTEKYPDAVSVIDVSGYYQKVETQDLRVEQKADDNTLGTTLRATDIGTVDNGKTTTDPTISAGTSSDLTVFYGNSESDSSVMYPAVEISNTVNVTISANNGAEKVTVDDTEYLVFDTNDVAGGDYATASIEIAVDSGASEASFDLTYDDLFAQYGADAFPTDSDIQTATSASQTITITV